MTEIPFVVRVQEWVDEAPGGAVDVHRVAERDHTQNDECDAEDDDPPCVIAQRRYTRGLNSPAACRGMVGQEWPQRMCSGSSRKPANSASVASRQMTSDLPIEDLISTTIVPGDDGQGSGLCTFASVVLIILTDTPAIHDRRRERLSY
jgi:hypothetical protein